MENPHIYKEDIISVLEHKLEAANARISELEAACVMGGDGKPIGLGQRKYMYDPWSKKPIGFTVSGIKFVELNTTDENCTVVIKEKIIVCSPDHGPMCGPSDCYSDPDSVPQGGE